MMLRKYGNIALSCLPILFLFIAAISLSACGSGSGHDISDGDEFENAEDDVEQDGDSVTDGDKEQNEDAEDESSEEDAEEEIDMAFCDEPLELPKSARVVVGDAHNGSRSFSDSDFVFDRNGDLISADAEGNLIRTTSSGERKVWSARAVKRARGMAFLSSGELVVADSGLGRLIKVYSDGQTRVLTPHLDFPNGLDVDRDDYIYVTEASRAAVSRVDPQSGKLETLALGIRAAANGLSFSPDYNILYFASQENGFIYAMQRVKSGEFAQPERVAVVPGLGGPCYEKAKNDECVENEVEGSCQYDIFGDLYCRQNGPCHGLDEGDSCVIGYQNGICQKDEQGVLECIPVLPCDGLEEGDKCTTEYGYPGICTSDGGDELYCLEVSPCDGKNIGDECEEWGEAGTCQYDGGGGLYCKRNGICDAKNVGDACEEWGTVGTCQEDESGFMYCRANSPCDGLNPGDYCEQWGTVGVCIDDGSGWLYCGEVYPCDGLLEGDPCTEYGRNGVCKLDPYNYMYCRLEDSCDDLNEGNACKMFGGADGTCIFDWWLGYLVCQYVDHCPSQSEGDSCTSYNGKDGKCRPDFWSGLLSCQELSSCYTLESGDRCNDNGLDGYCADSLNGFLYCQTDGSCSESANGDQCFDQYSYGEGYCTFSNDAQLYCAAYNQCSTAEIGEFCSRQGYWDRKGRFEGDAPWPGQSGSCQLSSDGLMYCKQKRPCEDLEAGDKCRTEWGTSGVCVQEGDVLFCQEQNKPCEYSNPGDSCILPDDKEGICIEDNNGELVCSAADPCADLKEGEVCSTALGSGFCRKGEDKKLYCLLNPDCHEKEAGVDCINARSGLNGTCQSGAGGSLLCQPISPCYGKSYGDTCIGRKNLEGICSNNKQGGPLYCRTNAGGHLHGLNTDLCGNIYVTDDLSDAVWRFTPDGSSAEIVAATLYAPITGIAWGSEKGGWDPEALYLSVSGGREILEVDMGIPGRRMQQPPEGEIKPDSDKESEEVDCMKLPDSPISIKQLDKPRGYHDVAFDDEGYIVGHDGFNLVRVSYDNKVQLFASGVSTVQGMDWLPDGSLVLASDAGIISIKPSGAQIPLATEINAYGLVVGPDGMIYAADNVTLYRINPNTDPAQVEEYLDRSITPQIKGTWAPRTIGFDFDHTLMYVGTWSNQVFAISLDKNFDPIGIPRLFAVIPGDVHWVDGLGVDYCGNLYMPNYEVSSTYRITPDGNTSMYLRQNSSTYGHGLEFGSGIGGWKRDSIYMPQPYNSNMVVEVQIGAPRSP